MWMMFEKSSTNRGREYLLAAFWANKIVPPTLVPGATTNSPGLHSICSPFMHKGYVTVACTGSPVRDLSLYTGASSRTLNVALGKSWPFVVVEAATGVGSGESSADTLHGSMGR